MSLSLDISILTFSIRVTSCIPCYKSTR